MKRYLVFSSVDYEAGGGAHDYNSAHDNENYAIEQAKHLASNANGFSAHVFDAEKEIIIHEF